MKIYCTIVSVVTYREIFQVYNNYHYHPLLTLLLKTGLDFPSAITSIYVMVNGIKDDKNNVGHDVEMMQT